jgi:hypothetical protein
MMLRDIIALVGGAPVALPLAARAQAVERWYVACTSSRIVVGRLVGMRTR